MLGGAQKIILLIFVILLIVIFGIVLWTFVQGDIESWPPTTQTCPDYWTETSNGQCSNILNMKYDGVISGCSGIVDFSGADLCQKYRWATSENANNFGTCGNVPWDGLSYGYGKYTPCEAGYNPSKL